MKKEISRQAKSAIRIRAERREKKLCIECGQPAVIKTIASTGKIKVLSRCADHLAKLTKRRHSMCP